MFFINLNFRIIALPCYSTCHHCNLKGSRELAKMGLRWLERGSWLNCGLGMAGLGLWKLGLSEGWLYEY